MKKEIRGYAVNFMIAVFCSTLGGILGVKWYSEYNTNLNSHTVKKSDNVKINSENQTHHRRISAKEYTENKFETPLTKQIDLLEKKVDSISKKLNQFTSE
jgi:hypothetical protein